MTEVILEIALATPLRRLFDYLPPCGPDSSTLKPGIRLSVPFGNRAVTGLLVACKSASDLSLENLKRAEAVLDTNPLLNPAMIELCRWSSSYYLHPLGDALFHALPPPLRKGRPDEISSARGWHLQHHGYGLNPDAFARAPRQQQALAHLLQHHQILQSELDLHGLSRGALQALVAKGIVAQAEIPLEALPLKIATGPKLNQEQQAAVTTICQGLNQFFPCLLEGITGSGKTEVYLNAIAATLERGRQALVLVPEIGLTPQTLARFEQRFPGQVVALHSGLSDGDRLYGWQVARSGLSRVVIGTRSAVFTQFKSLGLIVIDEEHDTSYKQQEGFRYSARDVAVKRAQLESIPVVLGSATPSAESLQNALQGRYQSLQLQQRAGGARAPSYQLLDLREQTLHEGFSQPLLQAIQLTLDQGNQVLVFLNRRGFAPALICHDCGWVANCQNCDVRMVVHRRLRMLKCHHCEAQSPLLHSCPACGSAQLVGVGLGTERSEAFLQSRFTNTPVMRIDRDTTRHKGAMDKFLKRINSGEPAILVGTQMLAKGHHFPRVTLVAVLDADAGLCSTDFRGPERTAQMLMQVAGRAGRAERPGTVIIQTHFPHHPILLLLIQDRYRQLCQQLLEERRALQLPPCGYIGMVRCDAADPARAESLLQNLREALYGDVGTDVIGPLAPPIARRAGRYRSQLLFKDAHRGNLHCTLQRAVTWMLGHAKGHQLRWSVDVDPQDFI
jgi:primosomal protein N' (replication factor Y)